MVHCAVPGCHVTGGKKRFSKEIKIHRLPANTHRARLWMKAIPRKWECSEIKKNSIGICSLHFIGGVKSDDPAAPNYVPTLFPNKPNTTKSRQTKNSQRKSTPDSPQSIDSHSSSPLRQLETFTDFTHHATISNSRPTQDHSYTSHNQDDLHLTTCTQQLENISMSTEHVLQEHDYITSTEQQPHHSHSADLTQHIEEQKKKISQLESDLAEARKKVLSIDTIRDKTECRQWTGLGSYAIFETLLRLVMTTVWQNSSRWCGKTLTGQKGHVKCLAPPMQMLMTLVRLKTGDAVFQLSKMFGVSEGLVSEVFTTWVTMLHVVLKKLFHLPPKHKVLEKPAPCYQQWKKLVIVLDCTEIFMESPKKMQANKEVFSNYKQHDTAKFLVGTSPNMCVIYVSEAWGGRASDKTITLASDDLLGWLKPQDVVMSDKGFLIGHELAGRNIKLLIPPFKGSDRSQFTNVEIEQSENVSKARVHVERLIGRIKSFEILQGTAKISMLDMLPKVFGVCAYLVNFQSTTVRY